MFKTHGNKREEDHVFKKKILVKLWMDKILHKLVGVYGICLGFPKIEQLDNQALIYYNLF